MSKNARANLVLVFRYITLKFLVQKKISLYFRTKLKMHVNCVCSERSEKKAQMLFNQEQINEQNRQQQLLLEQQLRQVCFE